MSNLRKIRESRKYTQGKLSYLSHVNIRTIKAYEQGYRDINKASGDTLKKLATALHCSIEDLLEDDTKYSRE